MLKRQPAANLGYTVNGICGQIFCHTLTDFTIDCALCDEKSLPFESFRSHIQNKHFEDILQHSQAMNTECNQYLDVSVKNEAISDVEDNFYDTTNEVYTDEENTNTLKKFATKGDVQEVKDKLESTNLILKLLFDKINLLQTIEAQPNTNTLRTTTDFQNNLITNTDLPPSFIRISVLPKIPFENKVDFLNLEIGVQSSEEMFANMIRELKQKVLGNSTKFIRNCWRLIMRDEVAKEFCWQGSPSKTSLKPLTTTLGIKMAYTEKFSDHTDVEFEKITIMHFQQAKNRCDKKSKNIIMLKNLPPVHLTNSTKAKCGEIFCHSSKDFTIYCTFCKLKSFTFEDFIFHIQKGHFENNLLKTDTNIECNRFIEVRVKNETSTQAEIKWDNLEESLDDTDDIGNDESYDFSSYDDEPVMVLKKSQQKLLHKGLKKRKCLTKNKRNNESDSSGNEFNSQSSCYQRNTPVAADTTHIPYDEAKTRVDEKKNNMSQKKEKIEHECPECGQIFVHLKYLDRHVFECHNGYKCSLCEKRFRLRHHLRGHAKTHSTEKSFTCPVGECGKSFTDQDYLKRHLEVHTMECTFICDFDNCGKAFQTQRRLTIHTYTHRKPKKLVCDACGYSCRANITLRIHQRVHTGEKPFGCEVCEKRFVSKTALTEHMISHSNTRPHICQICNASFANPRVLQRHIFIHSDERTFKCKLCDSAFKQARGLDGHMRRLHRPPKPSAVKV